MHFRLMKIMVFIHICKVEKIGFRKGIFERMKSFKIETT